MFKGGFLFLALCAAAVHTTNAFSLLQEVTNFYRTILEKGFGEKAITKQGLAKLMNLFDGNPKYNEKGAEFMMEKLGFKGDNQTITFEFFHEVVRKIYGDMISDDPYQPQEIHLALTNTWSEMKVMWATMENLESPFVQYQLETPNMNWESNNHRIKQLPATNWTYSVPQKWWPTFQGVLYEVNMVNLQPETRYSYRVGGYDIANQTTRYSAVFSFISAPDHNDPSRVTKVFTVADHGTFELLGFETVHKMVEMINASTPFKNNRPDFIFAAGDLSYAGLSTEFKPLDISKEDEFELIWDLLHVQNQPVASIVPWMAGNGNHERFYDWAAFTNRYHMPNNAPDLPSNGGFWYTFSYGNIQWISLSSEHSLDPTSEQYTFLRQTLEKASANRDNVPWIVVTIHKPLYCSVDGSPSYRAALEPILLEFDVDLAITGHMHAYERIHPVNNFEVTAFPSQESFDRGEGKKVDVYRATGLGPVHLMQGHAGGMQFERFIQPQPIWSAFRMANGLVAPNVSREDSVQAQWSRHHPEFPTLNLADDLNCINGDPDHATLCEAYQTLPIASPREIDLSVGYNYSHTFGFGYIEAINATHLHYTMIPNVEGLLNRDEFWLIKDHKATAAPAKK